VVNWFVLIQKETMGIRNIQILTIHQKQNMIHQARIVLAEKLSAEHRRGEHPWGSMRRECPLCQAGK
jgi:hypothetical protein